VKITFKRIVRDGQEVLLPLIDGQELPARSCTIKQGFPDDRSSNIVSRATIELNLHEGLVIEA